MQLLLREQVDNEEVQWLAKQIGSRLPPGWGATWTERGCGELTGTLTDQRQLVVSYLCHGGWVCRVSSAVQGDALDPPLWTVVPNKCSLSLWLPLPG